MSECESTRNRNVDSRKSTYLILKLYFKLQRVKCHVIHTNMYEILFDIIYCCTISSVLALKRLLSGIIFLDVL